MRIWSYRILLFFLPAVVFTDPRCRTCEEKDSCSRQTPCTCIHYLQEFNIHADCYNFANDSYLEWDTCAEYGCHHITFFSSEISTIPSYFFDDMPQVREIYLNSSRVQNLEVGAFGGLEEPKILQLEHNQLSRIKVGSLNNLETLLSLDLHNNRLETIESEAFAGLISLQYLYLSENQLRSIPYNLFNNLQNLNTLNLSHNHLSAIDFNGTSLRLLENLYLNDNNIANIEECFRHNDLLSILDMHNNAISHINDSCFEKVRFSHKKIYMDMNNNNISRLNFIGNVNLRTLNMSRNALSKIPVDTFKKQYSLENLDLSKNKIDYLEIETFSGAPFIKHLNLSNNQLKEIGTNVLVPLKNLLSLDITYNNLTYFDPQCFSHFDNFQTLYVQGNNFSCEVVSSIFKESRSKNFFLSYENNYSVQNIIGLPCNNFEKKMQENIVKENNILFSNISNIPPSVKNMDEKFGDSLNQLKRWIIIGFSIFPCIYVTVKLLTCFISRRKTGGLDLGQEMPMLS